MRLRYAAYQEMYHDIDSIAAAQYFCEVALSWRHLVFSFSVVGTYCSATCTYKASLSEHSWASNHGGDVQNASLEIKRFISSEFSLTLSVAGYLPHLLFPAIRVWLDRFQIACMRIERGYEHL